MRVKPFFHLVVFRRFASITSISHLSEQELHRINLLLPRLCLSSHLPEAINLVSASLSANPPPNSISLSILAHSLTSQPETNLPISLLNHLKHRNQYSQSYILTIVYMLVKSYFRKGQWKEALEVYSWMVKNMPNLVCLSEMEGRERIYGVLVSGFCEKGVVLEGLKVLRVMVSEGFEVGKEARTKIYRGLLREARIVEAKELLKCLDEPDEDDDRGVNVQRRKVLMELLDRMIIQMDGLKLSLFYTSLHLCLQHIINQANELMGSILPLYQQLNPPQSRLLPTKMLILRDLKSTLYQALQAT